MSSYRVTKSQLEAIVERINKATGNPTDAMTLRDPSDPDSGYKFVPGVYVLDWAYGGVQLAQIDNESGGERDITPRTSKPEQARLLRAFLDGVGRGREDARYAVSLCLEVLSSPAMETAARSSVGSGAFDLARDRARAVLNR